eukprot:scaffold84930_cov32-Attheya_sp.AAC.2
MVVVCQSVGPELGVSTVTTAEVNPLWEVNLEPGGYSISQGVLYYATAGTIVCYTTVRIFS